MKRLNDVTMITTPALFGLSVTLILFQLFGYEDFWRYSTATLTLTVMSYGLLGISILCRR
jgi:hypothetical protein